MLIYILLVLSMISKISHHIKRTQIHHYTVCEVYNILKVGHNKWIGRYESIWKVSLSVMCQGRCIMHMVSVSLDIYIEIDKETKSNRVFYIIILCIHCIYSDYEYFSFLEL